MEGAGMTLSFWEQDELLRADFIVVGAGLIGLQTALELRERAPAARITVLERGVLPYGASSRNAGFACFGSFTEILHDIDTLGQDAALAVVEQRWRGLARLRRRAGDAALGYQQLGGFELLETRRMPALARLDEANRKLRPLFGCDVFRVDQAALRASGFGPQVQALVANPLEGQLHSGKLMRTLALMAAQAGILVYGGVDVQTLEEGDGGVFLHAASAADRRILRFQAAQVALCTNGFLNQLAPDCNIQPARGQMVLTAAVPGLRWRGTYHMDEGYYYFRNVGEQVLLGGARNLDPSSEATVHMELTKTIQDRLEQVLSEILFPGEQIPIVQRWSGIMGFSADKLPLVRSLSPRTVIGFGCNGMGVALSADIAARTAELLYRA
jgi:glycine/D-amino acid oxidase-like deaminating enzyme